MFNKGSKKMFNQTAFEHHIKKAVLLIVLKKPAHNPESFSI